MKKLLSIALCATAVSAFGATVAELGQVGVTAITTSLSNAIVAVSYDDLAGGSGMIISNFVKTTNLTVHDQLAIFNGTGTYDTWTLEANTDGVLYWAKNAMTFTVDEDGQLKQGAGMAASGVTNAVGTGIWLVRQNPIDTNGNTNSFYIYGKPTTSPKSTIAAGQWTLIGNPTQGEVTIGTEKATGAVIVENATDQDQIVVPVPPDGKLAYYIFKTGKGWRTTTKGGQWDITPPKLGAGLGCWILTQKDASITW